MSGNTKRVSLCARKTSAKLIRKPRLLHFGPAAPFFLLIGMFLLRPLANMALQSFTVPGDSGVTIQNYLNVAGKQIYQAAVANSLYLSLVSGAVGLALSFLLGLSLITVGNRGCCRITAMLNMVSNFAGLPLSIAFIVILGTSGVLTAFLSSSGLPVLRDFKLYSLNGLLLLYIYFQIPLGTLLLLPAFQGIRPAWKEAAALMGASPFQFWRRVGIPMLLPSLLDTFAMLFANALTAYATPLMLMSTNLPLLAVKTASMFTGEMQPQQEMGAALSIVMLLLMLAVTGLCNLIKGLLCKGGIT